MTMQEVLDYVNQYVWSKFRLGLDRTEELLERLGNPQKQLKFIHVAGTNGKGSTCAMTERILREAGYRTGFYPSPEIETFTERIRVNGEYIPVEDLTRITEIVARAADAMEDHPSQFELITAIGFMYFAERKCDFVVLEVGMGGALDSTNVIDPPDVAVLTNIGLDHTEYLGDTIEKIAETKCGIIKEGSSVVSYCSVPEAMNVIRRVCAEKGSRLYEAPEVYSVSKSLVGQRFRCGDKEYVLSLLGEHQLRNAATVLAIIEALRDRGYQIPEEAIQNGFANTEWPVRFEVLSQDPLFILDGGHNPQCAEALVENIEAYLLPENAEGTAANKEILTFLIGMLADKDYRRVLELLNPYGANYICITPDSYRALKGSELAKVIREIKDAGDTAFDGTIESYEEVGDAIRAAVDCGKPVIAFGSLYSAGKIRQLFRTMYLTPVSGADKE